MCVQANYGIFGSIGTAPRTNKKEDESALFPGPGAYDQPSSLTTDRGIKLASRTKALSLDRCSPGPAAYDPTPYYTAIKSRKTAVRY